MNKFNKYKGKKVLVTGHTGFKGSWLTIWLHSLGAEVVGIALPPNTKPSLYQDINGDYLCKSFICDIRDRDNIKKIILETQPDIIFHLAAQPIVRESYIYPIETFEVNVIGTAHILDALQFIKKPVIAIMITTDKVYKNDETGKAYCESDPLGGYDPYSASKAAAEIVIDSYRQSFFNPLEYEKHHKSIASARAGNVIGGGDWAKNRLIPDIVRALVKYENIVIRNPNSIRPWQHVIEPLSGYLMLGAKLMKDPTKYASSYNFGPQIEDTITVKEMAKKAIKIWGKGKLNFPLLKDQPHEASLLSLSIDKSDRELGWKPVWSGDTALNNTIEWYKKYNDNNKEAYSLCISQIKIYIQSLWR